MNPQVQASLVGAGGVLVGVLLTLFAERTRRRWEDERRWMDVKRVACREFLGGSQRLYASVSDLIQVEIKLNHLRLALSELESSATQLKSHPDPPAEEARIQAEMMTMKAEMRRVAERQSELAVKVDVAWNRLHESSLEIVLLCSKKLQDACEEHQELIMQIHRMSGASTPDERELLIRATSQKFDDSRKRLIAALRSEISI